MKRLLLLAAIIVLFSAGFNETKEPEASQEAPIVEGDTHVLNELLTGVSSIIEKVDFVALLESLNTIIQQLNQSLENIQLDGSEQNIMDIIDAPPLEKPVNETFSVYNIEIGDTKEEVELLTGSPQRQSFNEYGVNWHIYHDNYRNFIMVTYDENHTVTGLFTNQELVTSKNGIEIGSPKELVLQQMGEPLKFIQKGLNQYRLPEERDYDVFLNNDSYITIFYDQHENHTVTAIQLISKELEEHKVTFYAESSQSLKEGFEYQLFDLTNAARVVHGLSPLSWDELVRSTARDHSQDMAINNYFNHTNLEGQSPFDRMEEDHIHFLLAGENLAYGQLSSVFAHEGLMNSLGHRENILKPDYEYSGVGVAFNEQSHPYFTQKFYAN